MECYLKQDELFKPLEKLATHKSAFKFRNKMNAQQRAQRAALLPLFKVSDAAVTARIDIDNILECMRLQSLPRKTHYLCMRGGTKNPLKEN